MIEDPPLRAWPSQAFQHEPAHGFFLRLAEENSASSTRVLADTMGLNGAHFQLAELLDFCLLHRIKHPERLLSGTPVISKEIVHLNGQKFSRQWDWSIKRPKVCGGCLGESPYYRNWWDLTIVRRCPIHDRPLVDGYDNAKLDWRIPEVGSTIAGVSLVEYGVARVQAMSQDWDAYVLGRIGVVPSIGVAILDDCELRNVVEIVALLGRAKMCGWGVRAPGLFRKHSHERYQSLRLGFEAATGGIEGVKTVLREYLETAPASMSKKPLSGPAMFGWLFAAVTEMRSSKARAHVYGALNAVATESGIDVRLGKRGRAITSDDSIGLMMLAREVGIAPKRLRQLCKVFGLRHAGKHRGYYHFSQRDADIVREFVADLITARTAKGILGVSPLVFKKIYEEGMLTPVCYRATSAMQFRRSEVVGLLCAVKEKCTSGGFTGAMPLGDYCRKWKVSAALALNDVLSGKLKMQIPRDSNEGLAGAIVSLDAG